MEDPDFGVYEIECKKAVFYKDKSLIKIEAVNGESEYVEKIFIKAKDSKTPGIDFNDNEYLLIKKISLKVNHEVFGLDEVDMETLSAFESQ